MTLSSCHSLCDQGGTHESPAGGGRPLCLTAGHPLPLPLVTAPQISFQMPPHSVNLWGQSSHSRFYYINQYFSIIFLSHQFALDFLHLATACMLEMAVSNRKLY